MILNMFSRRRVFVGLLSVLTVGMVWLYFYNRESFFQKPGYVEPVDGAPVSVCPLVKLEGRVIRYTFPGIPNFQSLEEGDEPETRWVLVISESEIQRLTLKGYLPSEDVFVSHARGWVQMIPLESVKDPFSFLDKVVVVKGFLGELYAHAHTSVAIEAIDIYDAK